MSALDALQRAVEDYLNSDPPDDKVAELCAQMEDALGEVQPNG